MRNIVRYGYLGLAWFLFADPLHAVLLRRVWGLLDSRGGLRLPLEERAAPWLLGLHGLNGVLMLPLSLRLALLASRRPVSARELDAAEAVAAK